MPQLVHSMVQVTILLIHCNLTKLRRVRWLFVNQFLFVCCIPTTPELTQTKATVDHPSTEIIPQEDAAVSALDAAGNNTVDTLQSDKVEEGTLVVCKPISFCLLYHANLIMFFVLSQPLQN
jgi:hypothetical protein